MKKFVISLFSFVLCFFLLYIPVHASQEFTSSLHTYYTVLNDGNTLVRQNISLRNNFSTIYATKYALEVGSTRISAVKAYTKDGANIPVQSTQIENKTNIALNFPDKVVGKDQVREFTIEYQSMDVSSISGNVLEISIPKLSDKDEFSEYSVTLEVPKKFGDPALVFPASFTTSTTQTTKILTFGENSISGVYVIFGEKQVYDMTLQYHLQNPTMSKGIAQVALPPDTPFQKVIYSSIEPKPDLIEMDRDGNWIATFTINSQEEQTIVAKATATIYLEPVIDVPKQEPNEIYLTTQKYWSVDDSKIKGIAKGLTTPRSVYDYVIKTLSYNYSRLQEQEQVRQGALESLAHPNNAVCQEYVDVFVSLARASGIYSREVNGYALTQNPKLRPLGLVADVLHAWPEYYDTNKKIWRPVDPTWSDTTGGVDFFSHLDFNHIAFAIHGESSEKPYPAGVYKISGKEQKDVEVSVRQKEPENIMDISLHISQNPVKILSLSRTIDVEIQNNTGSAWYNIPIQISADDPLKVKDTGMTVDVLLPYEKKTVSIGIETTSVFPAKKGNVHVTVGKQVESYEIIAGPAISKEAFIYARNACLGGAFFLAAYILWRILVPRRKR